MSTWTREPVFEAKIAPLLKQIVDLCLEHDIPFVVRFQIGQCEEHGGHYCGMAFTPDRASPPMQLLHRIADPRSQLTVVDVMPVERKIDPKDLS